MKQAKIFFGSRKNVKIINRFLRPFINYSLVIILFFLTLTAISELGYSEHTRKIIVFIKDHFRLFFSLVAFLYLLRSLIFIGSKFFTVELWVFASISIIIFLSITLDIDNNIGWLNNYYIYSIIVLALLVFEIARFDIRNISWILNPAQLFIISFGFLALLGTFLLMLPNATRVPVSFVDALFTSTSALCVTGLSVIDTASGFTLFGKGIILMLIQIGGIGIMSFTSFFGFFFRGGSSFSERFVLSDLFSEDNLSEITKTILKVVLITFLIELIGAICIYLNLSPDNFPTVEERMRISVFHSISAYCNAGFSTLEGGLCHIGTRTNIPVLYTISFLIIFGGIGFPILLNMYSYLKFKIVGIFNLITNRKKQVVITKLININSKLVIATTVFLLIVGTVIYFIFENNNTMQEMKLSLKVAHSFFGSVTPRTAGYNVIDYSQLSVAAIVLTIFLMWVGASPVSTGGGIKTSTFAIAMLNTFRIAKMKRHIEFNRREIHERSVNRAFAIVILSIIILGCFSLIIQLIEPEKSAMSILFECVSAFSTVGLSIGITPFLKDASKYLIIILMFAGRMGILTLLFAFFRRAKTSVYRYPKENIVIN